MERSCEEATTEESARGSARPLGRLGTQRSEEARQQTKRPQGWPGQKPQEENCRATQRPTPTAGQTPEEGVSTAVASIRARFGYRAIGRGYGGIRYSAPALR